jgi:hypothetical protein
LANIFGMSSKRSYIMLLYSRPWGTSGGCMGSSKTYQRKKLLAQNLFCKLICMVTKKYFFLFGSFSIYKFWRFSSRSIGVGNTAPQIK